MGTSFFFFLLKAVSVSRLFCNNVAHSWSERKTKRSVKVELLQIQFDWTLNIFRPLEVQFSNLITPQVAFKFTDILPHSLSYHLMFPLKLYRWENRRNAPLPRINSWFFLGWSIVGKIWDNVSSQTNKILERSSCFFWCFYVEMWRNHWHFFKV